MKIPNLGSLGSRPSVSLARIVSEDSQQNSKLDFCVCKSSKDS